MRDLVTISIDATGDWALEGQVTHATQKVRRYPFSPQLCLLRGGGGLGVGNYIGRFSTLTKTDDRNDEDNALTSYIQHEHDRFRELMHTIALEPARDPKHQDGPLDAGSSC
ncbi:hypothetical protein Tco_0363020 [Tanacetum coccineum]